MGIKWEKKNVLASCRLKPGTSSDPLYSFIDLVSYLCIYFDNTY